MSDPVAFAAGQCIDKTGALLCFITYITIHGHVPFDPTKEPFKEPTPKQSSQSTCGASAVGTPPQVQDDHPHASDSTQTTTR